MSFYSPRPISTNNQPRSMWDDIRDRGEGLDFVLGFICLIILPIVLCVGLAIYNAVKG